MSGLSLLSRFTMGDCHILARAIHEATGWPIATFSSEWHAADVHAFVQLPDGRFFDIQGVASETEMYERWYPYESVDACRDDNPIKVWASVTELRKAAPDWIDYTTWAASREIAPRVAYKLLWQLHKEQTLKPPICVEVSA